MVMFETTVDSIVSQFSKAIEKLENHKEKMMAKALKEKEELDKIAIRIATCQKEANRAKAVAGKLKEIVL